MLFYGLNEEGPLHAGLDESHGVSPESSYSFLAHAILSSSLKISPTQPAPFQVPERIWKTPEALEVGFFAKGFNLLSALATSSIIGASGNTRSIFSSTVRGLGGSTITSTGFSVALAIIGHNNTVKRPRTAKAPASLVLIP